MVHLTVGCGELCLQNCLSVHWLGLCLLLGLSVCWLGLKFGIGFVCLFVGGYVITYYLLTLGMVEVLDFLLHI